MILTFDIGNTRTNIGLYENNSLTKKFWILSKELKSRLEACLLDNVGTVKIDGAVIGSVVENLNDSVCAVLKKLYGIESIVIGYQSKLPVKLALEYPEKLGVDRLVNGAYAYSIYKQSVIVIDCGSAITFDIVNDNAEFVGGIIALGLKNQFKTLNDSTSALPALNFEKIKTAIGNNTKDAILSGVINGTASMIDGMIKKCSDNLAAKPKIVLTGGDSLFLREYLASEIDIVDPDFTLKGLGYLYSLNCV